MRPIEMTCITSSTLYMSNTFCQDISDNKPVHKPGTKYV